MIRRTLKTVVGALAAVFFAGCQGDPNTSQYTRSLPASQDIVGIWELDIDASDWQPTSTDPTMTHTLQFEADGTFATNAIPDVWESHDRRGKGLYESGQGTWNLKLKQDTWWVLNLNFREINGAGPGRGDMLSLTGQSPPYEIFAVLGDPDEGHKLVFKKRPKG